MKKNTFLLSALALLFCTGTAAAQTITPQDKILVAYYSKSGNTKEIATQISNALQADIFAIEPAAAYPDDYKQLTEQAKKEISDGIRPALKNQPQNLAQYDVIFVGSPCWWGTIATPVATFLAENNLSGKKIIPFMTHGGSGLGHSMADIKKLAPDATLIDGQAFWGRSAKNAAEDVNDWVKGLQND